VRVVRSRSSSKFLTRSSAICRRCDLRTHVGKTQRTRACVIIVENLAVPLDRRVWQEARALSRARWRVSVICSTNKRYPCPSDWSASASYSTSTTSPRTCSLRSFDRRALILTVAYPLQGDEAIAGRRRNSCERTKFRRFGEGVLAPNARRRAAVRPRLPEARLVFSWENEAK
jgi:hypothetical protein